MENTHPHPIEVLLLGAWLTVEAAAVLLTALVALLLTLARWRPAPDITADLRESLPVSADLRFMEQPVSPPPTPAEQRKSEEAQRFPQICGKLCPPPVARQFTPPTPAEHPLALLADVLQQLPQRELMTLAGTRRRLPKHQLAAMVIACS